MLRVGVIGCGYWGPNLIRNFNQLNETDMVKVADLDEDRLKRMKGLYPQLEVTKDYLDIINDKSIDVVAIATPVNTHHRFASEALLAKKHVFVEKPMTSSVEDAERLLELSEQNGCKTNGRAYLPLHICS